MAGSILFQSGQNEHISWGASLIYTDSSDLYLEDLKNETNKFTFNF
jgi:acyl-homoserine lactone acylase PvdQ